MLRADDCCAARLGANNLGNRYVVHEGHGLKVLPLGIEALLVQDLAMHQVMVVVLHLAPNGLQFH